MNHIGVRILAGVTAALILLSAVPGNVYAADMETDRVQEDEGTKEQEEEAENNDVLGTQETITESEEAVELPQEPLSEDPVPAEQDETEPEETGSKETESEETEPEETEAEQPAAEEQQAEEGIVSQSAETRESPAFDAVLEAGDLTVRLHADPGILPEGARAEVRELSPRDSEELMRKAESLSGGAAAMAAVDITFIDQEGKEIQPSGMVRVSLVDAAVYDTVTIYHVKDTASGEMEEIQAQVDGSDVLFENDSFSPYLLLAAAAAPDWTQGGAGTMTNVSNAVQLSLRDAEWSNYYTWGRGYSSHNTVEALTVRYSVYYKGRNIGTASCINPQLDGDYAEGRQADAVYEVTAPMLIKALYYGNSGPGRSVVQSVYNAGHDPNKDKNYGGPEIITHVAVSEIYARLYPSVSKTGPGRGFAGPTTALLQNDVNAFVSRLNSLPVPSNYYVYIARYNGNKVQDFAMAGAPLGKGRLSVRKSSAAEDITGGNSCYDLSGAEYRVYTSEEAARAGEEAGWIGTLTTGADGRTQEMEVAAGVYYCVESVPAGGYLLDETIYRVSVSENAGAAAEPREEPAGNRLPLRIIKRNRLEGQQQGRSLAGTRFEIRYYSGYYDADTLPEEPDRTWAVETEETDGGYAAVLNENAQGDPLYLYGGQIFLPLGTVTISETAAAYGYEKDARFGEEELYIGQIRRTEDGKGCSWEDIQGTRETSEEEILFDVQDTPLSPEIRTKAQDAENGTSFSLAEGTVRIRDLVKCRNLIPGKKYTLHGRLMDQATGEAVLDADGKEVTAEKVFTAADTEEEIAELLFEFETTPSFAGKSAVVFERLTGSEPDLPGAIHEDLGDEDQTVRFPRIQTQAADQQTGIRKTGAMGEQVIIDTVSYENLLPGKEYVIKGHLVDKESGEPLLINGQGVFAETSFTPDQERGTEEIVFSFDTTGLEGTELVAYEELYYGKALIGRHADPEDENQTICVPDGATKAADAKTGSRSSFPGEDCIIADTFSYRGLIPGCTYSLKGSLWDAEKEALLDPSLYTQIDQDGAEVTVSEFTPSSQDGETTVYFRVNAAALPGQNLVCFEELFYGETLLISHRDPEDELQTIHFPQGQTEASDAASGTKMVPAQEKALIRDTFSYQNLVPGEKYVITGSLRVKETGESIPAVMSDENGNPLPDNSFVLVPEEPSGEVILYFCADTAALAGKSAVVFERVSLNGAYVIVHENLEDEAQTVYFPALETSAEDRSDHDKTISSTGEAAVIDHVAYRNLLPGRTYRITGTLMDKSTGKSVRSEGREVRSEVSFVAQEGTGSIDVPLTFRADKIREGEYVVFEELSLVAEDQTLHTVGVHQDLHAVSQTVRREADQRTGPRTDDPFALYERAAVFASLLGLLLLTAVYRKNGSGRQSSR